MLRRARTLVLLPVLGALGLACGASSASPRPARAVSPAAPGSGDVVALDGLHYGASDYSVRRHGDMAEAVFGPMLPATDVAVLGAGAAAVQAAFGATLRLNTAKNAGAEVLILSDDGTPFWLRPLRQDTMEVYMIRIRRGTR